MALTKAQRQALTHRLQVALGIVADRSTPAIDAAWAKSVGITDADLEAFAKATASGAAGTKAAAVALASGYYSTVLGVRSVAVDVNDVPVAFDPEQPFIAARTAISNGASFDEARKVGANAAQAAIRNLAISSARKSGDVFAIKAGVRITGWERNAEHGACPWCQNLDGTVFNSSDAADFGHHRCHCTASPIAR